MVLGYADERVAIGLKVVGLVVGIKMIEMAVGRTVGETGGMVVVSAVG